MGGGGDWGRDRSGPFNGSERSNRKLIQSRAGKQGRATRGGGGLGFQVGASKRGGKERGGRIGHSGGRKGASNRLRRSAEKK